MAIVYIPKYIWWRRERERGSKREREKSKKFKGNRAIAIIVIGGAFAFKPFQHCHTESHSIYMDIVTIYRTMAVNFASWFLHIFHFKNRRFHSISMTRTVKIKCHSYFELVFYLLFSARRFYRRIDKGKKSSKFLMPSIFIAQLLFPLIYRLMYKTNGFVGSLIESILAHVVW